MFQRIVFAAAAAGLVAGLCLTAVQRLQVVPLILEAETYEGASSTEPASGAGVVPVAGGGDHTGPAAHTHGSRAGRLDRDHDGEVRAPAGGSGRMVWTAVANVGMAVGFALLVVAGFALRNAPVGPGRGALWGLAGFAVFFLNPALGLPPELPGAVAAPLVDRQGWWVAAVLSGGGGLGLAVLGRYWGLKLAGAALIALPHLVGAPHPEVAGGSAPESLEEAFVAATLIANAVFWVVLGVAAAIGFRLFGPRRGRWPGRPDGAPAEVG